MYIHISQSHCYSFSCLNDFGPYMVVLTDQNCIKLTSTSVNVLVPRIPWQIGILTGPNHPFVNLSFNISFCLRDVFKNFTILLLIEKSTLFSKYITWFQCFHDAPGEACFCWFFHYQTSEIACRLLFSGFATLLQHSAFLAIITRMRKLMEGRRKRGIGNRMLRTGNYRRCLKRVSAWLFIFTPLFFIFCL